MKKIKQFFSNLFYKPYGIKISIRFPSGEKRCYYITDSVVNDVVNGASVRFEFMHPRYGEIAKITLREPLV